MVRAALLCLLLGLAPSPQIAAAAGGDICWICKGPARLNVYLWKDEVAGVKRELCSECILLPDACYMCSLPVKNGQTGLGDGRWLCERDVKSVLLDETVILDLCRGVGGQLDKQLSRFVVFPTNISLSVADRITLMDLYKIPGKDYTCPNVLGFMGPETNTQGAVEYSINILSGQTLAGTEATCAHELTHAWIMVNVPEARQKTLHRDAVEGFCELVAYLMMREKSDLAQMAVLRANLYTRGQLDLFITAEQRFGFNQIVDWMKHGDTDRLAENEPWRVREAAAPRGTNSSTAVLPSPPPVTAVLPERLELKAVSMGKSPFALINQCTLGVGETGRVRLAATNLAIRCKAIRSDAVLVELLDTGEIRELRFENSSSNRAR